MPVKHFSMIRGFHLADFLTLANAACGVAGVFCAMRYLRRARDGVFLRRRRARARPRSSSTCSTAASRAGARPHSALGRELDSLADVISFGVAPAALGFAAGLHGGWDCVALIYFVCCGVSRLARYNVTAESAVGGQPARSPYFEGTPIPTSVRAHGGPGASPRGRAGSATTLYGGAWTIGPWTLHPLSLLFVLSGTLMISKTLRIPKL